MQGTFKIIQFILSDKHLDRAGPSMRHIFDKVKQRHFHSTSNEVTWPKNFSMYMRAGVKKCHFGQFFRLGRDGCALKNPSLWVPMNS